MYGRLKRAARPSTGVGASILLAYLTPQHRPVSLVVPGAVTYNEAWVAEGIGDRHHHAWVEHVPEPRRPAVGAFMHMICVTEGASGIWLAPGAPERREG